MAVIVPLAFVVIIAIIWPKGNHAAHLAGIGGALFVIWALIAVENQHTATLIAADVASGIAGFAHALSAFIVSLHASSSHPSPHS